MNAGSWIAIMMGVAVVFYLVFMGASRSRKDK